MGDCKNPDNQGIIATMATMIKGSRHDPTTNKFKFVGQTTTEQVALVDW
jgi:hypothetical protein